MMAHIVSLGHRRIAHIKGHRDHGASEWRHNGYKDGLAAAERGLRIPQDLSVFGFDDLPMARH